MDDEHDSDESRGAFAALEAALLATAARALLRLGSLGPKAVNKEAVALQRALASVESEHSGKIDRAIRRDVQGAMILSALDDLKGAFFEVPKGNAEEAIASAKKAAGKAYRAAIGDTGIFSRNMRRSAVTGYHEAAAKARSRVAVVGYDQAMQEAVTELARKGLTAYTYERKGPNGKQTVNVPVDVGIRRAIHNSGKQHQMEQMLRLAERTGANLVEVSWTSNPRDSHHKWEGKIYQLKGSGPYPNFYRACKVGDKVDGIGGYNCGHKATIYHEGGPRRFSDPLEGTGYTAEEASRLTSQQARLENEVRKEKRVAEVLEANGLDSSDARRRVRMRQKQLRELIAEHPKVLKRRNWRESIYEKARKEAGAMGIVHLDDASAAKVRGDARRRAKVTAEARAEWQARTLEDLSINAGSQRKHIVGTDAYRRKVEKVRKEGFRAPSRVTIPVEECERLVRECAGTGHPLTDWKGEWSHKEVCSTDSVVGYYVDREGRESRTRYFTIHYGKNGTHIVPAKDEGSLFDDD